MQPLKILGIALVLLFIFTGLVGAQQLVRSNLQVGAPTVVSYQGKVTVNGAPHDGNGYFKFAVVNAAGDASYWSNDNSSTTGEEPDTGILLLVKKGLFNVLLGDTSLAGMTQPLSAAVFSGTERYLRVWFSSDGLTYQQLDPDQRFAAVPYALQAQQAMDADTVDGQHASEFGLPAGAMVLGNTDNESALTAAGFSYSGQWFDNRVSRATIPTGRVNSVAAAVNDVIYVIGGAGNNATNEAYDTSSDSWSSRAPLLTGRSHMAVAVVNGVIYTFGGDSVASDYETTVEAYYPITNTWVTKTPMPTGRRGAAAAVVNGIIYVVGGASSDYFYETVNEAYDPATNSWSTKMPMPTGRNYLATAALDGIIYAIGGASASTTYETTNQAYNPISNLWTTKMNLSQGQYLGYAVAVDGLVYSLGRSSNLSFLYQAYDPVTNAWDSRTPPTFRDGFAMAAIGRSIYVFGGATSGNIYWLNEMYVPPLYIYRKD